MTGEQISAMHQLLDHLHIVVSQEEAGQLTRLSQTVARPFVVSFLNQHGFNLAAEDEAFREDLLGADLLLRDGMGLELCLKVLGREPGLNCNGTDLIPKILASQAGRRVAIFGTRNPWLKTAVKKVEALGVNVVLTEDGFQSDADYVRQVLAERPETILLAMGMPRQERLAAHLASIADWPVIILNGGAILDFYAERFARAPRWMRSARMEWVFRLAQEPRRLARRYLLGGGAFAWRLLQLKLNGPEKLTP